MAGAAKKRQAKEKKNGQSSSPEGNSPPAQESPPPSHAQPAGQALAMPPGGYDGAAEAREAAVASGQRSLDLGFAAWQSMLGVEAAKNLPPRPHKYNTTGKEISVGLNIFNIQSFSSKPVYQYDILVGNGAEKRVVVAKVWNSKTVQERLGKNWIFDGNRIAWSLTNETREIRLTVDLDAEAGRQPRPKKNGTYGLDTAEEPEARNTWRIYIKQTNLVKFEQLNMYLAKRASFDNSCLEAISFLDHLMRETPSKKFTQIRRSFFARGNNRTQLGGSVEAYKGVFSSIRIVNAMGAGKLAVNVDVANGTFWTETGLDIAIKDMMRARDALHVGTLFTQNRRKVLADLKRIRKLSVYVTHRGGQTQDRYIIKRVLEQNAKEYTFPLREKNPTTKEWEDRGTTTLFDYFRRKYNIVLQYWALPVLEMTKRNVVLPIEVCRVCEDQRYVYKLDDRQTANMIKFAVTPPGERWDSIKHGLSMLDWPNDPNLQGYGMKIDTNNAIVKARLLPAPKIKFANVEEQAIPAKGKWDLKGPKKFLVGNRVPLKAWGVCIIPGRFSVDLPTAQNFVREFKKIYTGHGGRIESDPVIQMANMNRGKELITDIWKATGDKNQMKPQILMFVFPDKDSTLYVRIKRECDCRYGVVSQIVQGAQVVKMNPQYISNVCMKFNAKLGGITAAAKGLPMADISQRKIMCIGADVSHAAPGSESGSMAAFTVSMNPECTRYAAQCDTNGRRVEIISTPNIDSMLGKLIRRWMEMGNGALPSYIFYFRDGVSEGQYRHVLDQEVRDIKLLCKEINPKADPKFIVAVASKRHHIRFFPNRNDGDRNGNPLPGTLVETGATNPFEFDFFLCSHAAIKGTARPVHYNILLNETPMPAESLQQMIYEHAYQYARSTTPVSLFPAIYYAHLASNRAKAHEERPGSSGKPMKQDTPAKGKDPGKTGTSSSDRFSTEPLPLTRMNPQLGIEYSMWYI